jgi:hypothetical protein
MTDVRVSSEAVEVTASGDGATNVSTFALELVGPIPKPPVSVSGFAVDVLVSLSARRRLAFKVDIR